MSLFIAIGLAQYVSGQFTYGIPSVDLRVDPLVDSKAGLIRGLRAMDGDYAMFLGIPYGKVDDNNPFGSSIPYPQFEETFQAFDDSAICPQVIDVNDTVEGTLDCLHLNVFVPTPATSSNRLPVLVWIHGGAFEVGYYNRYIYGPKLLVRHGIILVTINYRLGPYGFICPNIPEFPGNQGLKDQLLALRWVKDNIAAFGGDADKITIFGESAGAVSVDFHLYSKEENLFQKAILQSGVTLGPLVMKNPGSNGPLKLAERLGLTTNDIKDAVSFLATVDTNLVIAATNALGLKFKPCVENDPENTETFLADYPVNLNVPQVSKVPILIGFNNDEGIFKLGNAGKEYFENLDITGNAVQENFDMDNETFQRMSEILKHFYFGDREVNEETKRQVVDLTTDFTYAHPIQRSIKKYFDNGAKTIFSYMFSFVSERNFIRYTDGITFGGASHADELSYLFDVSYMKSVMSEKEQIVVDRMTTLWANFAKYGDPTPETTNLIPVHWPQMTKERWEYLNIDSDLTVESRPFRERMAFLDLFFKMNEKYLIGYHDKEK